MSEKKKGELDDIVFSNTNTNPAKQKRSEAKNDSRNCNYYSRIYAISAGLFGVTSTWCLYDAVTTTEGSIENILVGVFTAMAAIGGGIFSYYWRKLAKKIDNEEKKLENYIKKHDEDNH